jgi:hypothetical protein
MKFSLVYLLFMHEKPEKKKHPRGASCGSNSTPERVRLDAHVVARNNDQTATMG